MWSFPLSYWFMQFIWTEENSAGRNSGRLFNPSLYSTYTLCGEVAGSTQLIADVTILYCLHELTKKEKKNPIF